MHTFFSRDAARPSGTGRPTGPRPSTKRGRQIHRVRLDFRPEAGVGNLTLSVGHERAVDRTGPRPIASRCRSWPQTRAHLRTGGGLRLAVTARKTHPLSSLRAAFPCGDEPATCCVAGSRTPVRRTPSGRTLTPAGASSSSGSLTAVGCVQPKLPRPASAGLCLQRARFFAAKRPCGRGFSRLHSPLHRARGASRSKPSRGAVRGSGWSTGEADESATGSVNFCVQCCLYRRRNEKRRILRSFSFAEPLRTAHRRRLGFLLRRARDASRSKPRREARRASGASIGRVDESAPSRPFSMVRSMHPLEGIVDHAALFPPASLSVPDALAEDARVRASDERVARRAVRGAVVAAARARRRAAAAHGRARRRRRASTTRGSRRSRCRRRSPRA